MADFRKRKFTRHFTADVCRYENKIKRRTTKLKER